MTVEELITELHRQKAAKQVTVRTERPDGTLSREQEVVDVQFNGARVVIEAR